MTLFNDAKYERKPSGSIIIDGQEIAHTLQCCHCNDHFISVYGSGTLRGFCHRCSSVTCGKSQCDVCVPFEAKLDFIEGSKTGKYLGDIARLVDKYGRII